MHCAGMEGKQEVIGMEGKQGVIASGYGTILFGVMKVFLDEFLAL